MTEEACRRHGVTPRQHMLLLMIASAVEDGRHSTVTSLVDDLQLTQHAVSELVQRAAEAGLLYRERSSKDGRVAYLRLTSLGRERLDAVVAELSEERSALACALRPR